MDEDFPNPLVRALAALDRLEPAEKSNDDAALWQEARQALLAALEEREAFLAVVGTAAGLIDVLDDYDDAVEAGDEKRIEELAQAGSDAEDALVDALIRVQDLLGPEDETSHELRHLEALDRFTDDDEKRGH
jgi:hypothetical protein